jgi:hypothetical protein
MNPPVCRLCLVAHWSQDPHRWHDSPVRAVTSAVTQAHPAVTRAVTRNAFAVTRNAPSVTRNAAVTAPAVTRKCEVCVCRLRDFTRLWVGALDGPRPSRADSPARARTGAESAGGARRLRFQVRFQVDAGMAAHVLAFAGGEAAIIEPLREGLPGTGPFVVGLGPGFPSSP